MLNGASGPLCVNSELSMWRSGESQHADLVQHSLLSLGSALRDALRVFRCIVAPSPDAEFCRRHNTNEIDAIVTFDPPISNGTRFKRTTRGAGSASIRTISTGSRDIECKTYRIG